MYVGTCQDMNTATTDSHITLILRCFDKCTPQMKTPLTKHMLYVLTLSPVQNTDTASHKSPWALTELSLHRFDYTAAYVRIDG